MNQPNFIGTRTRPLRPGEVFDPATMKLFDIDEAYEAYEDELFSNAFDYDMPERERYQKVEPARKAIAQAAPITNRLMQAKSDMEAFAALSPEQKRVIIQFAKQNGIAKYVGSDNVSIVRQAWRNRGR